jgi:tetratricopeptide (TPR) repeat protein
MEQELSAREHYDRGLVLKQVQIFDLALDAFRQAAIDPDYAGKAHAQMGLCFRATGRYQEAVTAFDQALESRTLSSVERVNILYLLGQTLESLGRYTGAMEAYDWIRTQDPDFRDVAERIKHLTSGGRVPLTNLQPVDQSFVGELIRLGHQLKPHIEFLLGEARKSLGRYAENLETDRWFRKKRPTFREVPCSTAHPEVTLMRRGSSASTGHTVPIRKEKPNKRRHARVAVRLRSQFTSKTRIVAGEGELRDLSVGGCRVISPVEVPIGAELECCIFPQDEVHPFTIEGATVRWSRPQEFGLAFTNIRPGVQRQIAQLCRKRIPLES